MEKVDYAELDRLAHELSSLGLVAGAAATNFGGDTDQKSRDYIDDILANILARIPQPLSALDASMTVRANLKRLKEEVERMQTLVHSDWSALTLEAISIRSGELELLIRRGARSVSRQSETRRITHQDRTELKKEFGWQLGEDIEKETQRVHRGVQETLRRFPETRTWTAEEFGYMLGIVNFDVIKSAPAFMAITDGRVAIEPRAEETIPNTVDAPDSKTLAPTDGSNREEKEKAHDDRHPNKAKADDLAPIHGETEEPPSKYRRNEEPKGDEIGPLVGAKKDLGYALHTGEVGVRQRQKHFDKKAQDGTIWARRSASQPGKLEIFFTSWKRLNEAKTRLDSLTKRSQTK